MRLRCPRASRRRDANGQGHFARDFRMNKAAWALLALGLIQLTGEILMAAGATTVGRAVKAVGAATTASPAPKVFTSVRGLETFSTQFTIEWDDRAGQRQTLLLTPELYQRICGPYNRRNVF